MGQDLKGRELGVGIAQRKDGRYTARFVDKRGKRKQKYFKKLQECRRWLAEAAYIDRNSDLSAGDSMTVDAWFDYFLNPAVSPCTSSSAFWVAAKPFASGTGWPAS